MLGRKIRIAAVCAALACLGATASAAETLVMASGPTGGLWSRIALGIAQAVQAGDEGYKISTFNGIDGVTNAKALSGGTVDLALVQGAELEAARQGLAPFDGPLEGLSAVAALGVPAPLHVLVRAETAAALGEDAPAREGMPTVEAVAAKPDLIFGLMPQGGISAEIGAALLDSLGQPVADASTSGRIVYGGLRAQLEALGAGRIDVLVAPILLRHGAVAQAADTYSLAALALSEASVERLQARYGMRPALLPEGAYGFVDRPVPSAESELVLAVRRERDTESVAAVAKALFEHLDRLRAVHPLLSDLTRRDMAAVTAAPLHPGARAYLSQIGLAEAQENQ